MASDRPKINSTSLGLALAIVFLFFCFFRTIFVLRAYSWQEKGKLSFLRLSSSHLILRSHRSRLPLPSRRCLSRERPGFTFHPVQRAPEKSGGAAAEPLVKTPQNATVLAGRRPEEAASAIWTPGFPRTDPPENKCVFALGRAAGL